MAKKGLLLINIGSPRSYEVQDVKKYLQSFLMDKNVITLPFLLRWPLVNLIIAPRRAPYSAENYKKVWMDKGSPITVYTQRFAEKLQQTLGSEYVVKVGLRYSEPSVETALHEMEKASVDEVLIAPLFPQYADATTGSSLQLVKQIIEKMNLRLTAKDLPAFFAHKAFIETFRQISEESLAGKKVDHYLFSFHGLPESHLRKTAGCLTSENCCLEKDACAKNCYRAQCYSTASEIAKSLNLAPTQWTVAFQSRLGRGQWLQPATDQTLEKLGKAGKKNIAVICPSFVTDCIETLEEIGIGGQEIFHKHQGEEYYLVPCLNDDPRWVSGFSEILKELETTKEVSR